MISKLLLLNIKFPKKEIMIKRTLRKSSAYIYIIYVFYEYTFWKYRFEMNNTINSGWNLQKLSLAFENILSFYQADKLIDYISE